jgi:hypothetical protein
MSSKAVSSTKTSGFIHGGSYAVHQPRTPALYRLMSGNRPRFRILVAQQQGGPVAAGDGVGDRVEAF